MLKPGVSTERLRPKERRDMPKQAYTMSEERADSFDLDQHLMNYGYGPWEDTVLIQGLVLTTFAFAKRRDIQHDEAKKAIKGLEKQRDETREMFCDEEVRCCELREALLESLRAGDDMGDIAKYKRFDLLDANGDGDDHS